MLRRISQLWSWKVRDAATKVMDNLDYEGEDGEA
jgi:hypothetical protein